MYLLAKYNVQTDIYFPMVKRGVVDLAVTADWTPATGDAKVSKDGGATANSTNNPASAAGTSWKLTLTASELSCKWLTVQIVDAATKAVEDQFITVLTYGNASAFFPAPDYQDAAGFGLSRLDAAVSTRSTLTQAQVGITETGTAQAGAAGSITLRSGASATDNFYNDQWVVIVGATGAGQARRISGYVGSTKVASVDNNWATNPDATSTYIIFPAARVHSNVEDDKTGYSLANGSIAAATFAAGALDAVWSTATRTLTAFGFNVTVGTNNDKTGYSLTTFVESGTAQAGAAGTITLRSGASATDNFYNDQVVLITGGTGAGQARRISGYTGSTKVAAVDNNWATTPDNTSTYVILAAGRVNVAAIVNGIIAAATFAAGAIDATAFAQGAADKVWSTATRVLTAGTNIVLAKGTGVTGFTDIDAATVKTQAVAALNTDTYAEPSAVPAATATLVAKIGWLAALARNKITQTASTQTLRNDADGANVSTAAVSDDGTTFTRSKWT